jgi:hypothetical protein
MPSRKESAAVDMPVSTYNRYTCPSGDARDMIDKFIISHLVLGVGRCVSAQKHAHDVISVPINHGLLDQSSREFANTVQPRAKSAILARGQVADIFEQWSWDVLPGLLEHEVVPSRVERGVDAINCVIIREDKDISTSQRIISHHQGVLSVIERPELEVEASFR